MASNTYNPYNYPYPQSAAQSYSAYQTAPASSDISQSSRQYQPVTTQSTDYMSYQTQPYGGQGNAYGGAQDNLWGGSSYGGNQETTNRAAEVLHNMSNTTYTPNTTAGSQPGFTAAHATPSRYSSNTPQAQQAHQPPQSHTAHSYGQSQARPHSVNTNRSQGSSSSRGLPSPAMAAGYPSQRVTTAYNQQQRPASPAQPQYAQNTQPPVSSARSATMTAATLYNDYSRRQLPNLDASRGTSTAASASYSYGDSQSTANNVPETYNQSTITVDPMAVYDPWPEYQRKQEAIRAQKAAEDAVRAEEERMAEEARREEEQRKEEERKQKEEEERARLARMNQSKQKGRKSTASTTTTAESSSFASAAQAASPGDAMESEIRALMAKMREFNSKDPAMLARIWEEERRAKAPKLPTVPSKPAPQGAPQAQPAQASAPPAANQRIKAAPKETSTAAPAKPATPVTAQPVAKPPAAAASTRTGGNTVWPPEKKAQLALAAATYLNGQNPNSPLESEQVLRMLDSNPSYIELCEQLEGMGLKLDRAAFAKNLLTAVPDVNSASRHSKPTAGPVNGAVAQKTKVAPPAVMKRNIGVPATPGSNYASAAPSLLPDNNMSAPTPVPVAEMVPLKPELKPPANKEEAARKRNFNDLIDLTQVPDGDDFEPLPKKANIGSMHSYASPGPAAYDAMDMDEDSPANFPIPATPQPVQEHIPPPVNELRYSTIVEPLDRKKALRRNTYNIKTIARDVLLACGRHPETRQLNQHLEILKSTLPQVTGDADLSTLRWDLIDPGRPPPGYFKDSVQGLAEDADDEEDSEGEQPPRRTSMASESTGQVKVQAPPAAVNPFKQQRKRRGRPPRHSYPGNPTAPSTPKRSVSTNMSASAPRPATAAAGVGYAAFRSATEYDADGKPLPKKKGRPVGWRKNIHGSAAAQARPGANGHTGPHRFVPSQPSTLRNVRTGDNDSNPIRLSSRSPSVSQAPRYQSFKCKWQNCKAELHNLQTLKKHVHKIHRKETPSGALECLWADCGTEVANHDPMTNMRIERFEPQSFNSERKWQDHLEQEHFSPVSWQLGDGPAGGLSDANDSEAYLSDAQGRRVTPRITPRPEHLEDNSFGATDQTAYTNRTPAPRGRGRPPKNQREQEAREVQSQLISQKKRVGGPGMDRGGATLVNEKRRKGFSDNDETEEELVDAEN